MSAPVLALPQPRLAPRSCWEPGRQAPPLSQGLSLGNAFSEGALTARAKQAAVRTPTL